MPFDAGSPRGMCAICGLPANLKTQSDGELWVDCLRCGDYRIGNDAIDFFKTKFQDEDRRALASHIIRKMQQAGKHAPITKELLESIEDRSLPRPAEVSDNLLIWIADKVGACPSNSIVPTEYLPWLLSVIGAVRDRDLAWHVENLKSRRLRANSESPNVEELKRAHVASKFAFFARQFKNANWIESSTKGHLE